MKQRAAEAAGEFAIATGRLDEMKLALQEAAARLTEAQEHLDRLQKDAGALEARNRLSQETLPAEIEKLQATLGELAKQKDALDLEISDLKSARESLFAARAETAALAARNDALETRHQELRDTLPGSIGEMMDQLAQLRDERDALGQEITQVQMTRDALLGAREELAAVTARSEAVVREIELARRTRDDLLDGRDLADARRELAQVGDDVAALRAERATLGQMATRAALEAEIAGLRQEASGTGAGEPDSTKIAADLAQLPSCLEAVPSGQRDPQLEDQALFEVEQHLGKLGLKYDRRTLYAFHTALKINETSQMMVLAGVSGTGKSLLPRRYAEAMGLRFLQISVEPRWDSPQDLLGFYNYIEKRYRATDLARALVHMDPHNSSRLSNGGHEDEMLLVLLDEMNLARVEYYFSAFLSRLEMRPRMRETEAVEGRTGACLSIDIPGRPEEPIRLFPSHNVLFAGTMNDDESTQSLSDKVLDRSNVMQFPAPNGFARPAEGHVPAPLNHTRSFLEWQKWIKPEERLVGGDRDKARRVIDSLAKVMDRCGRPFGHRLNEAILAYVVNYPRDRGTPVDVPLADQIELRILPKLRGLAIQDNEQPLTDLSKLVSDDLRDPDLARALNDTLDRQRSNNQFNWRGFNRGQG
jgi:AAA domain (dynein-related subfamily)